MECLLGMRGSVAHVAVGHGGSCLLTARATNQLAPLLRIKMRNKLKRSLQDMEECNAEQLDIYDLAIPGMAAGDMLDFDMFELDEEDTCGAATELFRSDMDNLASFLRIDPNNISITLVKPEIKVKEDYVDFENYENGIAAALVTAPRPPKGYISAFNFFAKETRAKLLIMKKYQKVKPPCNPTMLN